MRLVFLLCGVYFFFIYYLRQRRYITGAVREVKEETGVRFM
jgi:hypothetical protein